MNRADVHRALEQTVTIAPGVTKQLGDCTPDDVSIICARLVAQRAELDLAIKTLERALAVHRAALDLAVEDDLS